MCVNLRDEEDEVVESAGGPALHYTRLTPHLIYLVHLLEVFPTGRGMKVVRKRGN